MLVNNNHLTEIQNQEQTIRGRVELYEGSTLIKICNCGETLEEFTIEKTGEGKYFGYGICQKLKASIIDVGNELNLNIVDGCEASFGVNSEFIYPYPKFYIQEIERDEVFNIVSFTAFDTLYRAANHTVSELTIPSPFTLKTFAGAIATVLGLPLKIDAPAADAFNLSYDTAANFSGNETLRSALDAIAEATQTIYYIDGNWNLYFKRLDKDGAATLTIGKDDYITFSDEGAHTLGGIAHATELGDNVEAGGSEGDTQYIRNNPFWDLRSDVGSLLDNALAAVNGLTINQFECDWRGNYLLEIGDKVTIVKDDDTTVSTFILDDNITFDGTFWQLNRWAYDGNEAETPTNPTTLGEALNQTYARVDKVNNEIKLLTQETDGINGRIAELTLDLDGITARVSSNTKVIETLETNVNDNTNKAEQLETKVSELTIDLNSISASVSSNTREINALETNVNDNTDRTEQIETKVSELTLDLDGISAKVSRVNDIETTIAGFDINAYNAVLEFKKTIENEGVSKLDTSTGFTFDESGLRIEKSGSEIFTTITEDGMTITKSGEEVLTADNAGVNATNLKATTYLIIGETSRLESWTDRSGKTRTACFWIGR